MRTAIIAAALSLPVLLTACGGSAPARHHPPATTVQCSRLKAAGHQISADTYTGVASSPSALAGVASVNATRWVRMLHHAAADHGPAGADIALAEAAAATLGIDAKFTEDGIRPAHPVTSDWNALQGDLRRADTACR